jgi:hypothetical protein
LNDRTFDNRKFSWVRLVLGVVAAVGLLLVTLPLLMPLGILTVQFLLLIAAVGWHRAHARRHARTLARQPTTPIARLSKGYVEISGSVAGDGTLELRDPIQNKPCVWFGVETLRFTPGSAPNWVPFRRAASSRAFILRDATGSCLVDAAGAQIVVRDCVDVAVNENVKHRVWRIHAADVLTIVGWAEPTPSGHRMGRPRGNRTFLIADEGAT